MKFHSIKCSKNHITNRLQRFLVRFRTISNVISKICISIFGFCKRLGLRAGSPFKILEAGFEEPIFMMDPTGYHFHRGFRTETMTIKVLGSGTLRPVG